MKNILLKLLVALVLVSLLSTTTEARLGWSKEKCREYYGPSGGSGDPDRRIYTTESFKLHTTFYEGKAVKIGYQRRQGVEVNTAKELAALFKVYGYDPNANSKGFSSSLGQKSSTPRIDRGSIERDIRRRASKEKLSPKEIRERVDAEIYRRSGGVAIGETYKIKEGVVLTVEPYGFSVVDVKNYKRLLASESKSSKTGKGSSLEGL